MENWELLRTTPRGVPTRKYETNHLSKSQNIPFRIIILLKLAPFLGEKLIRTQSFQLLKYICKLSSFKLFLGKALINNLSYLSRNWSRFVVWFDFSLTLSKGCRKKYSLKSTENCGKLSNDYFHDFSSKETEIRVKCAWKFKISGLGHVSQCSRQTNTKRRRFLLYFPDYWGSLFQRNCS